MDGTRKFRRGSWLGSLLAGSCLLLMMGEAALATHLRGQIVRVGYGGTTTDRQGQSGDIYRVGRYVPIQIELTNDDGDQFDGIVEVRQNDVDGDEVSASLEVSVTGRLKINLYVPGGPIEEESFVRGMGYEGPAPFAVHVFDMKNQLAKLFNDKGEPIKELTPPRQVVAAPPEAVIILDASQRPVNQIDQFKNAASRIVNNRNNNSRNANNRNNNNNPSVEIIQEFAILRCAPKDLPDHVSGLEMADILIWDGADPNLLDSTVNEAIIEWVKRGGRLVLGVSRNWNLLAASRLGPLLPGHFSEAKTESVNGTQLTFCPMRPSDLMSDAISVLPASPKPTDQVWFARRPCGRGEIVLASAELKDLLSSNDEARTVLREDVLGLRETRELSPQGRFDQRDVFKLVAAQTAFQQASGFYFVFAFAFVIGYIAVATGLTWGWLKRRGAVRQSWLAFAGVAVATSGLSLGTVQLVRTIGQGVHEMTIIDGRADSFEATSLSYLGLKTASHTLVDLCVPYRWDKPAESTELRGTLRPQPAQGSLNQQTTYSVPMRYQAVGPIGELREVPVRATLKQFQATWRGEMTGRLLASLRYPRGADQLDASSWIDNQLGTDLHSCYLFVRRDRRTQVYFLPSLPAGGKVDAGAILQSMEEREKKRLASGSYGDLKEARPYRLPVISDLLVACLDQMSLAKLRSRDARADEQELLVKPIDDYVCPLLLLSFYNDRALLDAARDETEVYRSQGQELEMSTAVRDDTALFVGFSEDPGPSRLCRRKPGGGPGDWRAIKPSQSAVMYRILVPVK